MVDSQLRPEGVADAAVVNAVASLPREKFVPAAARALAYGDRPVPLGNGRALTPPAVTGRLAERTRTAQRASAPWSSAPAADIAPPCCIRSASTVTALESDPALAALARAAAPAIDVIEGDLAAGYPGAAPYDIILIDGAVEHIPEAITAQLVEGGRIGAALDDRGVTRLAVGRNVGGRVGLRTIADADVGPLPGFERPTGLHFLTEIIACDA